MRKVIIIIAAVVMATKLNAFSLVNIWEGTECGAEVTLKVWKAQEATTAVIVCPGGSYFWHDRRKEGDDVAAWLQQNGITAFVLDYRTAGVPAFIFRHRLVARGTRYPDAQDDLRQALCYVRNHAEEYGIDKDRVGVMGFSAGGHLAMSSTELFSREEWPSFVVSVYPVVTMFPPYVHKRSRRGLMGDSRVGDDDLKDLLSLERHVPDDCPPVFLVNCVDDPIVDYHNAVLLDAALTDKGIAHQYLQYPTGGHGFGVSDIDGVENSRQWRNVFLEWIMRYLEKGIGLAWTGTDCSNKKVR